MGGASQELSYIFFWRLSAHLCILKDSFLLIEIWLQNYPV